MLDIQTLNCTHILTYTIYITAASYMTVLGLTDLDQPCAFKPYFNTWNSRLAGIYRSNEKNRNLGLTPHSYNYYYCPPTSPPKKNPSPGNYRKYIWLNTENKRGGQTEMVLERQAGTRSRTVCSTAKNLNHKFRSMITTTWKLKRLLNATNCNGKIQLWKIL